MSSVEPTLLGHHLDRAGGADDGAQLAPLAVVEREARECRSVELDRGVRAVEPAEQAVDAELEVGGGLEPGSPATRPRLLGFVADDDAAGPELRPGVQAAHRCSFTAA